METMMSPTQYLDDVLEGDESEEELFTDDEEEKVISKEYAVLSWLRTFSGVKSLGVDAKIVQNGWFENKTILGGLLGAATEICRKGDEGESRENIDWNKISDALGCNVKLLDKQSYLSIFYALLCHAVSDACLRKNAYVSRIMELDRDVQRVLMQIIQDGKDKTKQNTICAPDPDESYLDDLNIDEDNESLLDDFDESEDKENVHRSHCTPLSLSITKRTPVNHRTPKFSYRSPMASANRNRNIFSGSGSRRSTPLSISPHENYHAKMIEMERDVAALKDTNEALCIELNTSRQQESLLRAKLEETDAKNRAVQLKIETNNLATIADMKEEYEERISSLERKLDKSQKLLDNAEAVEEELLSVKDEVDVLKDSKMKLLHSEDQLRKMKAKMVQVGNLSKALATEEKAHGEAVAKCLELENKLAVLAPLKRQLEDYKIRATDAEVRLVDCEDEIRKLKENNSSINDQNKELQMDSIRQQAETEDLRRKIQEDDFALIGQDTNKVGEGMTELNPELKEELLRLRNENKRLAAFAAKREDDSVQLMEEQLEDANRLATKFKDQFLSTKNSLEETQKLLKASLQRESSLKYEVKELHCEVKDLKEVIDKERTAAKEAEENARRTLQSTIQSMSDQYRLELDRTADEWETKLNQRETDWDTRCNEILSKSEEKVEEFNETIQNLRSANTACVKRLEEDNQEEIKRLQNEHRQNIQSIESQNESNREELIAKGKQMIQKIKNEGEEKIESLEIALVKETKSKDTLMQQQIEYEERVGKKISSYKNKLNVSQLEAQEALSECEDLRTKLKKIEREKVTLQGENDRFRRQMNGRSEFDQGQYEELQREYNVLLQENQSLKNATNLNELYMDKDAITFDTEVTQSYSSGQTVSASSLSQLRAEYEDQIEELRDEKRQLVMKNSALITDEKRATHRVWDLEVKLKDLEEKNTSLQLQIERIERNRPNPTVPKKRIASKISPRALATKAWKMAKSNRLSPPDDKKSPENLHSPNISILPNLDLTSPEFKSTVKSFREKLTDRLSSVRKENLDQKFISQDGAKSVGRNIAEEEWEFHIN